MNGVDMFEGNSLRFQRWIRKRCKKRWHDMTHLFVWLVVGNPAVFPPKILYQQGSVSVEEVDEVFDAISYCKGALCRMRVAAAVCMHQIKIDANKRTHDNSKNARQAMTSQAYDC